MKTKKTLQHIAAVAVVLLALCLVFMMPAMAYTWDTVADVNTTTVSSVEELTSALTDIEDTTTPIGSYEIKLSAGEYDVTSLQINQIYGKSVLLNGTGTEKPVIKGKIQINGSRHNDNPEALKFENLKFDGSALTPTDVATGVILFMNGEQGYAHNVEIKACEIVGPGKTTKISGIYIPGGNGYVYGLTLTNVKISSCFSPVNGRPVGDLVIIGCEFTDSHEGVNVGGGGLDSVSITGTKISAETYAVRLGNVDNTNSHPISEVTLEGNTLQGKNQNSLATVIFRADSYSDDVTITGNIITGDSGLLMMKQAFTNLDSSAFDLSNNYWGGSEPTEAQLGGISFAAGTSYYTALTEDDSIDTDSFATAIGDSVAEVGGFYYDTLQYALKNLTDENNTLTLLDNVTISDAWDCRNTGAKILLPVTIDGAGHSIKLTGTVDDRNWNAVFRFEKDATVKNLTIDVSEATGVQRGITAMCNLTVDKCTLVGKGSGYGIIFGEGAGTAISTLAASITNSKFEAWSKGVSDNANGQDAKSMTLTGNTFENADVALSAHETVTFTNNIMNDGGVNLYSYYGTPEIIATGNTLDLDEENKISAKNGISSLNADSGFTITKLIQSGGAYYASLQDAVDAADSGATITLVDSVSVPDLVIGKSLTIDGNGKTLTGMVNLSSDAASIDVTLKNIIVDGDTHYAVKVGTKANLLIDGATLTGWNAVYVSQAGQTNPEAHGDGSTVTIKNSELSGTNTHGAGNDFGTVVVFANETKVDISGSTLKASATNAANQSIIRFGASADKAHTGSSVSIVSSNLEVIANTAGTGTVSLYSIGSGEHGGLTFTLGNGVISNVNPSAYIAKGMEVVQPGNLYKVQTYVDRSGPTTTTKPVEPETPVDPEQPEEPVDPEIPVDPETPGTQVPEVPVTPVTPEDPSTPAPVLAVLAALGVAVVLRRK